MHDPKKLISVVVPCYNEEKNVELLYSELCKYIEPARYRHEFIFINDGSADNTFVTLSKLASSDASVRVIDFTRNFGHQSALEAGLAQAQGDAIVMMDADMQHPPSLVPRLLQEWENGFKVVNTLRTEAGDTSWFKKVTSSLFYKLFNSFASVKMEPGSADFRLVDKDVKAILLSLREKHKFFRGLVSWTGYTMTNVTYTAQNRIHGTSSYTLKKMLGLANTGITSFSTTPMKLVLVLGTIISSGSSLLLTVMVFVRYFINFGYFSPLSFVVVFILLNTGLVLVSQGLIALYIGTIHKELQDRPSYIIRCKLNC